MTKREEVIDSGKKSSKKKRSFKLSSEGDDTFWTTFALNAPKQRRGIISINLTLRQKQMLNKELMREEWMKKNRQKFFKKFSL